MELRFKSKYDYNFEDHINDPNVSYTETTPDLNIPIRRLLQDFTRDPRDFKFDMNDEDDDVYLPGENYPSVDPLTEMDEIKGQLDTLRK